MRILFYDTKSYEKESFSKELKNYKDLKIRFIENDLDKWTVRFAKGYDAICVFVNTNVDKNIITELKKANIKLILLRSAGFNNVDIDECRKNGIIVMRVPSYSPEAIAEMAIGLAITVNRKIHKAYIKVRENNFSLVGLIGINFSGKTAGIIGTGRIGQAMARICYGFGMNVIAFDNHPRTELNFIKYVSLEELLKKSDLISLHCALTQETYHLINKETIAMMKDGVILVNTSRGGLIKTNDLINGIRKRKFLGVGLDVYEEEGTNVFKDREDEFLEHSTSARLLSFPNVIITSHQAFLTKEALEAISKTTLDNAKSFLENKIIESNLV